ncbi:stage V sporulation protein AC [Ureibacillus sp. FSL K6-0786]|uniref:stage V sporulation protein AC n=1 Tax=Ureibacillus sp. FSL K6-0786 TaxID=2954607 RepID=UPI0030D9B559
MNQEQFEKIEQEITPPTPYLKNVLKAFLVGGLICTVGHAITYFYIIFFDFTEKTVGNPTVATIILISMLLTGFGLYQKLGQFAGAGSAVPVSGFGNAVISAAIEHRTEGFVLGVGGNMFKLAGSVILFGVSSAFVVALIKLILVTMGVIEW